MTGGELLRQGTAVLRQAGLDQPRLEAEVLLAYAWGRTREELLIHPEQEVPEAAGRQFLALVGERAGGVPTAYLTGAREFMSLVMTVTPAVLIPRPETELLVEEVLRWLASLSTLKSTRDDSVLNRDVPGECWVVADVGTGSGAIAVSLAHYHPVVQVAAIDISEAALDVAVANACRHGLAGRVRFLAGDLLTPLLEWGDATGSAPARHPLAGAHALPPGGAAVVANLPYVPTDAWDRLPRRCGGSPAWPWTGVATASICTGACCPRLRPGWPRAACWPARSAPGRRRC